MRSRILSLVILVAKGALGCSCSGERPPCAEFGAASAVFLGNVLSIEPHSSKGPNESLRYSYLDRRVTFEIIEWFHGATEGKVSVITGMGNGDCGYPFRAGMTYLVYA